MANGADGCQTDPKTQCLIAPAYLLMFFLGPFVISFFYMIFYFIWPEPVLFDRSFIYTIFPNLKAAHAHLSAMGREDLANDFVNYQANMVLLSVVLSLPYY